MNKLKKRISATIILFCLVNAPQAFACVDCVCPPPSEWVAVCM